MLKGYIEGYYGRLFSEDERAKVINHMGKLKMDFYLYGPKEDLYHRIEWGKTYPAKEQKTLRSLVDGCKKNKIKPIFAISPGLQSSKLSKNLLKTLTSKYYTAGSYDIKWNGTNNSNIEVPSGVYIYQLTHDVGSITKKMILLR